MASAIFLDRSREEAIERLRPFAYQNTAIPFELYKHHYYPFSIFSSFASWRGVWAWVVAGNAAWARIGDDRASKVGDMCWWEYMYAVVVAVGAMMKSKWIDVLFLVHYETDSVYL